MGRDLPQLHARAGDDFFRIVMRIRQPADILIALEHSTERLFRLREKTLEHVGRKLAHVAEHTSAMLTDDFEIASSGQPYLKLRHRTTDRTFSTANQFQTRNSSGLISW